MGSIVLCFCAVSPTLGFSQTEEQAPAAEVSRDSNPVASVPPRSADGRLQILAVGTEEPVRVDGSLDDQVWQRSRPVTSFIQAEPDEGEPATEETEVWVAFDDRNLYIAAYCHDEGAEALVVNDIRKDFESSDQDTFEVLLDTFADRRNGYIFMTNPEGARADQQQANEGREINPNWDAVWSVRTQQLRRGWTLEMSIPLNSLRFDMGKAPVWGINFSRRIRRKNEVDFWSPVPRSYTLTRASLAGNLVGLPVAEAGRNLRVKPYVAGKVVRGTGAQEYDPGEDVGLDMKYGVTQALTLDVTVHPDFAQVEADEQEVNLTQFSQFFPEKREFFLENSGIFYVGDAARNNRVSTTPTPDQDLLLFFSRRIGLSEDGTPIPIVGGARLTGNLAGLRLGALSIQTKATQEHPANNYAVVRARKNIFTGSDVGAIFMMRQSTDRVEDYNRVYGIDANIRFLGNIDWNSYLIKTATPGLTDGQYAFRTTVNREGNFFHFKGGLMSIGDHFNDELGYYRRIGVRKWLLDTGIRPRFDSLKQRGIREMHPHVVWSYFTDHSGRMVAKKLHTGYTFFFNNGGFTEFSVNPEFQLLTAPFYIHRGSDPIPPGGYGWTPYQLRVNTDPSRTFSAGITGIVGGLWTGTQRTINAEVAFKPSHRFRVSLGVQRTRADLEVPKERFVTSIWTMRTNYSFNTNMFLDSLLQYDRDRNLMNANIRFNLIHHPLSDVFVVYNEQRFMTPESPITPGRSLIVKFTQMMSF